MLIRLWKGFHSPELPAWIAETWQREELFIFCPPGPTDFSFLAHLPEGIVQTEGDWDAESLHRLSFVQAGLSERKSMRNDWPAAPVFGVFTTGTVSGVPRLVLYSKANIQASLEGVRSFFDCSRIQSIFCYPQPFHTFGLVLGYLQAFLFDLELVVTPGRYSRESHLRRVSVETEKLLTLGTPTHFYDLVQFVKKSGAAIRPSYSSISGGAKTSVGLWKSMRNDLKTAEPSIGYGATEAAPAITHHPPGRMPIEDGEIGFPIPGLSLELKPPLGLEFAAPNACLAMIQGSRIEFPERILIRDHLEKRESDGVLLFRGRYELILNRGGMKFSLERIQEALEERFGFPAVCVSLPDIRLGEELGVLIKQPEETPLDRLKLDQFLKEMFGSSFNPRYFVQSPEFPINENSKINRAECTRLIFEKSLMQWVRQGGALSYPVPAKQLAYALPHRPPAIWVDQVNWSGENEGECEVRFDPAANYAADGKIRQSSFVEWMAQSFGYVQICHWLEKTGETVKPPEKAYLVAIKDLDCTESLNLEDIAPGDRLRIQVKKTHQLGPLSLVDGTVLTESNLVLAKAQIKLFAE